MAQPPEPPPEALLLARKRRARRLSPAEAARLTGFSASTYRQTENGYHVPAKGVYVEKIAPAETLARMLHALGGTPRELIDAGRADAAEILEGLLLQDQEGTAGAVPPAGAAGGRTLPATAAALAEKGIGKYREVVDFERVNGMEARNEDEARIWAAVDSGGPGSLTEEEARTAVAYRRLVWDKAVRSARREALAAGQGVPDRGGVVPV